MDRKTIEAGSFTMIVHEADDTVPVRPTLKTLAAVLRGVALAAFILSPPAPAAQEKSTVHTVPIGGAVYVYWGPSERGAAGHEIFRKSGAEDFRRLTRVTPLTDPGRIEALMKSSPDSLSSSLTFQEDFHRKAEENPGIDLGLSRASMGYAQVRGHAYLDSTAVQGVTYRYRVVRLMADGGEKAIGEAETTAGRSPALPAPQLSAHLSDGTPVLSWSAAPFTNYDLWRSDAGGGPFARLNLIPIAGPDGAASLSFPDTTALADGRSYLYRITPVDIAGQPGAPSTAISVTTPDQTAPDAPQGLEAVSTPSGIRIAWQRAADAKGYNLYRAEIEKDRSAEAARDRRTRLNTDLVAVAVTEFEDRGTIPGRIYLYEVTATDPAGNESLPSPPVLAAALDRAPPAQPRAFTALAGQDGSLTLRWRANTEEDLSAYRVYEEVIQQNRGFVLQDPAPPGGLRAAIPAARLSAPSRSHMQLVTEVPADRKQAEMAFTHALDPRSQESHRYAVSAVDATGNESPLSDAVTVRLPDTVPPESPILTGFEQGDGAIAVRWGGVSDPDLAGYNVYRRGKDGRLQRLTAQPLPAEIQEFKDAQVEAGEVYEYLVSAVDNGGNESLPSEGRSASTFRKLKTDILSKQQIAADLTAKLPRLNLPRIDGAVGFLIYVSDERDGEYRQVGGLTQAKDLKLELPPDLKGWYRIQAVFPLGLTSDMSEPVEIKAMQIPGERGPREVRPERPAHPPQRLK